MKKEVFDFYNSTSIKSYNLDERIRYQLKMLDSLDSYTRKHTENVANITCRLCEKLKLSKEFTIYCTTCAYLHDIGKMFIPPSILQKPSRLTDDEFEVMKTHSSIGYKMCMNDLKLRPYAAGALYHHEALDGTGYPHGVTSDKIPLEGKIIRVADEFEAITAKRQYKSHVGVIDALNILIKNTQPTPPESMPESLRKLKTKGLGRIDKRVLKALFKVIIDDTEYEIAARCEYVDFLKDEIKRIQGAQKYYHKMKAALTPGKREYLREEIKCFLKPHEDPEKVPEMIKEFTEAYDARQKHIKKLNDEIKQIKRLVV